MKTNFRPENHIIGKVYDLTQENMCVLIAAFEENQRRIVELEAIVTKLITVPFGREYKKAVAEARELIGMEEK